MEKREENKVGKVQRGLGEANKEGVGDECKLGRLL